MDVVFSILSGVGLLALSVGAFGVLDAFNKHNVSARRVDWLIALYSAGVLANVAAYTMLHRWYVALPLALMLVPAEMAFDKRGTFRRRSGQLDALTGRRR